MSVIYISHRLGEIEQIADRAVALRDGRNAGELDKVDIKHEKTKNATHFVMAFTLGIDYGTNSVRALFVDVSDGRELATCVIDYPSGKHGYPPRSP